MSPISYKKNLPHLGTALFSLILLGTALWAISHELKAYRPQDIIDSLESLPRSSIFAGILLTSIGYWIVTAYDWLALQYIRHPLPYGKIAFAAFTSFAISNSLGFVLLTGGAIRYRFYLNWGLSAFEIAQVIAFGNLSFWLGMLSIGGILFTSEPLAIPDILTLPFQSLQLLGIGFITVTIGYLLMSVVTHQKQFTIRNWSFYLPSWQLSSFQILVSVIDWGLASGVLYLLLPSTDTVSFTYFFAIYLLAQLVGIISHIPGGLGVFETAIVLMLSHNIPGDQILAALLAYRGIYYFLPFVVAVILLGMNEWQHRRSH